MARNLGETTVTIPVLDRLIDLEPGNQTENPPSRSQSERLLGAPCGATWSGCSTRAESPTRQTKALKEVNRSAYMYGLPDLSALTMATSGDRNKLVRQIVAAINLFEPRLANVRLVMVENPDTAKSEVRLRIEAMLRMDPSPEPISFDTVIELKSGNCRLSGGDDAR
jgi:type VI secretion system protein ImpF